MALTVTHPFVSAVADGADATVVRPSNWNANHTLSGSVALNEISAATGAVTIASGNNTGIVWNWFPTADGVSALALGETTAATGGTSTLGVPNQVLLSLATLAASTMSPLKVKTRGNLVFTVDSTNPQILFPAGTIANPNLALASAVNTGLSIDSATQMSLVIGGTAIFVVDNNQAHFVAGTAGAPSFASVSATNTGIFLPVNVVGISTAGIENSRFLAGALQHSKSAADAVSYSHNFRKSRGTVASPTVITTGDDLATIDAFGYVGATNTYQSACRIVADSTGTISDSATGIGGIWRFLAAKTGAEPAEIFSVNGTEQHTIHSGTAPTIGAGGGTNPSIVGADEAALVTIGTGGVATSVTISYANNFTNAPIASAQSDTDIVAFKVQTTISTCQIDATAPFSAGSKIHVISRGYI